MLEKKNKIEKLISKLCPNDIKYFDLGTICKIETGKLNANAAVSDGRYMFFTTAKETSRINKYSWDTEALLIAGNANVGDIKYYLGKFDAYQRTYVLINFSKIINIRFLYFVLKTNLQEFLRSNSNSAAMTYIVLSTLENFKIPVPPLPIQEEIVKILDNFTELETELEAELEARKKQYEYYRNKLLNIKDAEYTALENVTIPTQNIKWREITKTLKYIDLTSVSRENHSINEVIEVNLNNAPSRAQKLVQKDDVIFATTRPTLQRFTIIDDIYDGQVASTGYCVLRAMRAKVLPEWIYFNIFSSRFNDYVEKNQEGSAYPSISDNKVKKFKIPVPPLAEQKRIVAILDKFDALVNDISIGLPAEIKARHQQYEYYRNKLLTFKEYVQ